MALSVKDSFLDLERHRQILEENIEKLRKSLRHWQTWEAEYEGLKEEILAAKSTPNHEQLATICNGYEGELVTKKEVREILGGNTYRSASQVINLLDRRLDYVQQNVRTVKKQIETAENKLVAATVISTPDVRNEEGLPLMEIVEELDDEDNVISSHLSTPGSAKPQLLEVLEKAGVKNFSGSIYSTASPPKDTSANQKPQSPNLLPSEKSVVESAKKLGPKAVTFTEDTKSGPEPQKSQTAKRLEDIMKLAKSQEERPSEPPVIPTDESAEDGALRREMLQYGMSEIGAVVAEIDLEEGSDWTDDEHDEETSSDDDEDAYGRSTSRVVDDELRQRMIELEERLGARVMENIGKKASDYEVVQEGIGRITISGQKNSDDSAELGRSSKIDSSDRPTPKITKKSVRFSEELDVSPDPKPPSAPTAAISRPRTSAPVSDIVERNPPAQPTLPVPPKKTSRFKSDRNAIRPVLNGPLAESSSKNSASALPLYPAKPSIPKQFSIPIKLNPVEEQARTVPTGPKDEILASTIVERDPPLNAAIPEPDELDPQLLNQEVATEYHKMRNRMIQRQGGFMKEEESEIVPFTEEEGGPKKMSRFKAARLARS